ncbi:MAG: DUF4239 domain-containing protein [Bacteroidetes bacterium]|nr:DUF4239 domain-containing protein [Bacteroidota bacterium]
MDSYSIWDYLFTWILLYTSFAVVGYLVVAKLIKKMSHESNNELVITTFNISAVLFSLTITFVVVAAWENWDVTEANIDREANAIASMYIHTAHLPDSVKKSMRTSIKNYTTAIIKEDWPSMATNADCNITTAAFLALRKNVHNLYDLKDDNRYFYDTLIPYYMELAEYRRGRLHASNNYLPEMVWYILFVGSFVTIFISFFYKSENVKLHLIMNFVMALMFSMSMFICYDLSHPFKGTSRIKATPFEILFETQFKISEMSLKN